MNRPRDRASAEGLLPRMEARPWADGKTVTYRYHTVGGKPLSLGTDRLAAVRKVLDLLGASDDRGTVKKLWQLYQGDPRWHDLKPRTQADFREYSTHVLRVFGDMQAAEITPPMVAQYLRVERGKAPVRANREMSLLGTLIGLAIERGEATSNPCRGRQVQKNRERPSTVLPAAADIEALIEHAQAKKGQWLVVAMGAEFAALVGARQAEFLPLHWPAFGEAEVRLDRAKQRKGSKKVDKVEISPALLALRERLLVLQRSPMGPVFPNRQGNCYTAAGYAAMWGKLMREAVAAGVVKTRFNFHALRAYYTTAHKAALGSLPDLHATPTTTAKVYERSREASRKAL